MWRFGSNADHGFIRKQGLYLAAICIEVKTGFLGFSVSVHLIGLHKEQLHLGDIRIYLHPVLQLLLAFVGTIALLSEFEADKRLRGVLPVALLLAPEWRGELLYGHFRYLSFCHQQ
jgi:hypothetical protein